MHHVSAFASEWQPTILLVEDDAKVRSVLVDMLQAGATVLEAEDGSQAMEALEGHGGQGVDLLLLDYLLPKRSGLEVLRLTTQRWPWIPTVIITGLGSEDLAIEALRAGARDYLRKPIRPEELARTVEVLISEKSAACQRERQAPARRQQALEPLPPLHPAVYRAITFVEQHFCEPITLADVAGSASLSKFHFCRLFRRETRVSLRDHLRDLRIARAQTLLRGTRLTVTEIAFAVGFNDLSHFDRVFNKIAGVTPSDYRKSPRLLPG